VEHIGRDLRVGDLGVRGKPTFYSWRMTTMKKGILKNEWHVIGDFNVAGHRNWEIAFPA